MLLFQRLFISLLLTNPVFSGRKLVIATMHGKEASIAPIISEAIGVECFVPNNFDTDQFGTFSGEIERKTSPLETARLKCLKAMEQTKCDMAIASEGSFGQHPELFFTAANEEFLLFLDKKNDLEIIARELSTLTNYRAQQVTDEKELRAFSQAVGFPDHGIILKKSQTDFSETVKGITDANTLNQVFSHLISSYGCAYIETDMRALYNPTRMHVIQLATHQLVKKIKSICPNCNTPGFGITSAKQGLLCRQCSFPTRSTLSFVSCCQKCGFEEEEKYPHGKQKEDPMYCDFCNP